MPHISCLLKWGPNCQPFWNWSSPSWTVPKWSQCLSTLSWLSLEISTMCDFDSTPFHGKSAIFETLSANVNSKVPWFNKESFGIPTLFFVQWQRCCPSSARFRSARWHDNSIDLSWCLRPPGSLSKAVSVSWPPLFIGLKWRPLQPLPSTVNGLSFPRCLGFLNPAHFLDYGGVLDAVLSLGPDNG